MVFTSSRLGGPQIFMKDLSSGSITRVSKNGGYNTEANLSPDGTLVTYSRMTEYGHRIFVQDMVTRSILWECHFLCYITMEQPF